MPLPRQEIPGEAAAPWQRALQTAVRDIDELARLLSLPAARLRERAVTDSPFPLRVPRGFVARMRPRDPDDPLLLQVLPRTAERSAVTGFVADPLAERGRSSAGVVRKYPSRVLLIASGSCPIHCRYCFRREYPYADQLAARDGFRGAVAAIAADASVREVILSGGDPLSLANNKLAALVREIETCAQVDTLRIHTRFPITVPERVDAGLLELLASTRLATVVVVHSNHANEIAAGVPEALRALGAHAGLLLNQSVLLAGINDDVDTLEQLSRALFTAGVLPYYVHLLDKVRGTAHFDVDEPRAVALIDALRTRLPGYLVPRLVREIPGELGKTPIR